MESRNSKIYVTRTIEVNHGVMSSKEGEDVIAIHKFETTPAEVAVDYALTMNLGNYESAKIGVSVRVPCYVEEIDQAYEFAQAWAEERLQRERDLVTAGRKDQTL